jgi:hypothetical protein
MSTKEWKPNVSEEAPDEEALKRYKLVVEQISEANFRQCMLARNVGGGGPPATEVTNYYKGASFSVALAALAVLRWGEAVAVWLVKAR